LIEREMTDGQQNAKKSIERWESCRPIDGNRCCVERWR